LILTRLGSLPRELRRGQDRWRPFELSLKPVLEIRELARRGLDAGEAVLPVWVAGLDLGVEMHLHSHKERLWKMTTQVVKP
jgi:hypothetical protein